MTDSSHHSRRERFEEFEQAAIEAEVEACCDRWPRRERRDRRFQPLVDILPLTPAGSGLRDDAGPRIKK